VSGRAVTSLPFSRGGAGDEPPAEIAWVAGTPSGCHTGRVYQEARNIREYAAAPVPG